MWQSLNFFFFLKSVDLPQISQNKELMLISCVFVGFMISHVVLLNVVSGFELEKKENNRRQGIINK